MLLESATPSAANPESEPRPAPASLPAFRALKRYVRPESMRTEELAQLMRGFDADAVKHFTDFKEC
jgi:hypothetical protein